MMHTADYDEISDDQMRQDDNYEKKITLQS